jgi:exoribonuclease-2
MKSTSSTLSLAEIARRAMIEKGFIPDFPDEVVEELSLLDSPGKAPQLSNLRDMRDYLWISIDNNDSKDLDQLTYAETRPSGKSIIYIAVADVDSIVKKNSAIDAHAANNTTSVYTAGKIFPMLPLKLSTDLTSLNENAERSAIVIELEITQEGAFNPSGIYPALVRNQAKLAYDGVADWLENQSTDYLPVQTAINSVEGLAEQLKLQDRLAQNIKKYRDAQGALSFVTIEIEAVVVNGIAVGIKPKSYNRAHAVIENFMIAANFAATRYLMERNLPTLKRIVRTPKRWDRIVVLAKELGTELPSEPDGMALRNFLQERQKNDPENFPDLSLAMIKLIGRGEYILAVPGTSSPGHFDLAIEDYSHTTAPNRRFPDLVMQRLLKSAFISKPSPYTNDELVSIAEHCTQKEDDAVRVERRVNKLAAAMVLANQVGKEFDAMVTGATEDGTWVRLFDPPIEGKLVRGSQGVDVGDRLKVTLLDVDINRGYIDFGR